MDVAQLLVPGLTAAAGAWYATKTKFAIEASAARDAELRRLVDQATDVLERAHQKSGRAVLDAQTGAGVESLNAFSNEVASAAQLRHQIASRTLPNSPISVHFESALEAIADVRVACGTVAMYPNQVPPPSVVEKLQADMSNGVATFEKEFPAFVEAARTYFAAQDARRERGPLSRLRRGARRAQG